ncbi:AarF/ABC1/UbiB kinase family protein [Hwanghaeella grinnelliae]|uniref:AarF/ABC1/UbiB kinase family protein n=1 Tax=Hwanghaeella grinnelliae TaxID=2500179 RepID=A0A437QTR1_9PROT|nr:AarF/ABC1/UbiB kinase family protein [Hwanghaeella grinnelliae]RVU37907.1 AarF/ABC1/UbiB kinase family protein [Hwanghaeella grinnelliae]
MSEKKSLTGQVKRYARVGGAMAGVGARLAGARYLGMELDKSRHAEDLKLALGGLKGPLMKVAQILATIPDALPRDYVDELQQLQSNAPAMGWPFVKRRMTTELGPGWTKRFDDFEKVAAHAASLGQVHRAVTTEGEQVACKLQYPDMASAVEADLRQLKLIFSIYERYDNAINTNQIHTEISERLREELDYQREARAMTLYGSMLADEDRVTVPEPVLDLTTDRLLTMNWLDGKPLMDFTEADLSVRNDIAFAMFRAWYVPFYYYGVIHGDPHLGNYAVRQDHGINLLDFGCIRVFPPSFVEGVISLYKALRDKDQDLAVHAYETWGFENLSNELLEVLNIWAGFIYAPLMEDKVQKIQESDSGLYGASVAHKVHVELRKLGGVTPPREFVLMDRAAIGLGSVFMHLKAEVNWYRLFHELIADFDVKVLEKRQKSALTKAGL